MTLFNTAIHHAGASRVPGFGPLLRASGASVFCALALTILAPVVHAQGDTTAAPRGADSAAAGSLDPARTDTARADTVLAPAPAPAPELSTPDTAAAAGLIEAAVTAAPETLEIADLPSEAPIFIGGREVFRLKANRDGLLPVERVAAARKRIARAVADRTVSLDSLRLSGADDGVEVRLGTHFLWLITPGDLGTRDPRELAVVLGELTTAVRDGVERERSGRTPLRILISVGIAILLTLAAIALFRVLIYLARHYRVWLAREIGARIPAIRIRGFEVLSKQQLRGVVVAILGRLDIVVGLVLLYAYLTAVFSLFPWTQGWAWLLLHFATRQITDMLSGFASAIPGLIVIVLIFFLFRWITGLSDRFFDAIDAGTLSVGGFHPELAKPSKRLVRMLLWIIAFMVAYPYIPGAQTRAVQGVSIFLGILVSLGSTGIVGNILAGLVLTYSRSFKVGDRVKVGDVTGDVLSLGFFSAKFRTITNEEITIPNGQVATAAIVNYTRLAEAPGLILHTTITIGYDVEWRKVHGLLTDAAATVEGIETDPKPWVFQTALNDYNVAYQLNAATHDSHAQARLYSDLHAAIQDAFNKAGVEILSPGYQAIRDANAPVLPAEPQGPRPEPGAFRVRRTDSGGA